MKRKREPTEIHALRELARGTVRRRTTSEDSEKLVQLGLARRTADGVTITRHGREIAQAFESGRV